MMSPFFGVTIATCSAQVKSINPADIGPVIVAGLKEENCAWANTPRGRSSEKRILIYIYIYIHILTWFLDFEQRFFVEQFLSFEMMLFQQRMDTFSDSKTGRRRTSQLERVGILQTASMFVSQTSPQIFDIDSTSKSPCGVNVDDVDHSPR